MGKTKCSECGAKIDEGPPGPRWENGLPFCEDCWSRVEPQPQIVTCQCGAQVAEGPCPNCDN